MHNRGDRHRERCERRNDKHSSRTATPADGLSGDNMEHDRQGLDKSLMVPSLPAGRANDRIDHNVDT